MSAARHAAFQDARRAMETCKELDAQLAAARSFGAPAWETRPIEKRREEASVKFHRAYAAFKYPKESSDER